MNEKLTKTPNGKEKYHICGSELLAKKFEHCKFEVIVYKTLGTFIFY